MTLSTRLLAAAFLALLLSPRAGFAQDGADPFAELQRGRTVEAVASGTGSGSEGSVSTTSLLARGRRLLSEAFAGESADQLDEALRVWLELIAAIEAEFGLDGENRDRIAVPFWAHADGFAKAHALNEAYLAVGQIYELKHRHSLTTGSPDKTAAARAVAFYWQAGHTAWFEFGADGGSKTGLLDLAAAGDPNERALESLHEAGNRHLARFVQTLVEPGFRFDATRSSVPQHIRESRQKLVGEQYVVLETVANNILTTWLTEARSGNGPSDRVDDLPKQRAVNTIAETWYQLGEAHVQAAREYGKDVDWLLALQSFERASTLVYWCPTRRFDLNAAELRRFLQTLIGQAFDTWLPAEELAKMTGLSLEKVQAAQRHFGEQIVQFIDLEGVDVSAEQLNTLIQDAQGDDDAEFRRHAVEFGLAEAGETEKVEKLLATLKKFSREKITANGYWLGVQGRPDWAVKAREYYFQILEERFAIPVETRTATLVVEAHVRAQVDGRAPASTEDLGRDFDVTSASVDDCHRRLQALLDAAESLLIRGEHEQARALLESRALPVLDELARRPEKAFAGSEFVFSAEGFQQLRSRVLLKLGEAHEGLAAANVSGPDYERHLRQALVCWFDATDESKLAAVSRLVAERHHATAGDSRLPGRLVDDPATASRSRPHENRQAIIASQRLNDTLTRKLLGSEMLEASGFVAKVVAAVIDEAEEPFKTTDPQAQRWWPIRNLIHEKLRYRGIFVPDEALDQAAREILEKATQLIYNPSQRETEIRNVLVRLIRQNGTQALSLTELRAIEEDVAKLFTEDVDDDDPRARFSTADLRTLKIAEASLERWGNRLKKAATAAMALNQLFYRKANEFRAAGARLETDAARMRDEALKLAEELASPGLSEELLEGTKTRYEQLEEDAKEASRRAQEMTLSSLQFYYMASRTVYHGGDEVLAIQLPAWDAAILIAVRGATLVARDMAPWISTFLKQPKGQHWQFVLASVKKLFGFSFQDIATKLAEPKLVQRTGAAILRGVTGFARSPVGRLASAGAFALVVWMMYSQHTNLERTTVIELPDTATADQARIAFWELMDRRVLPQAGNGER